MMNLTIDQERKLKELRALYQYDKALAKQAGHTFESKEVELEVLASLHLSRMLQTHIEDFMETIGFQNLSHLVLMGVICNEALGKIAGHLDSEMSVDLVDEALKSVDEQRSKFRLAVRSDLNMDQEDE